MALTRLFYCEPPNADFAWMGEAHAANFERSEMAECLARGGDPKAEGIAEHGELMGGRGQAATTAARRPQAASPFRLSWRAGPLGVVRA